MNHAIERDGLRYEFSAISGNEYLWDLTADPSSRLNLAPSRIEDARRLRDLLARELGIGDVKELHAPYRQAAEALRGLGYL